MAVLHGVLCRLVGRAELSVHLPPLPYALALAPTAESSVRKATPFLGQKPFLGRFRERGRGLRDCAMADRRDRGCAGARHSRVRRAVRESNRPALAGAIRGGFGPAAGQNACAWRGDVKEPPSHVGGPLEACTTLPAALPQDRHVRTGRSQSM